MRGNRITSQSLLISLILHGVILLVLGAYITYTQSPVIQEFVASTFLKPQKAEKPPDRPPEIKPIVRPTIPTEQIVVAEEVPPVPRVITVAVARAPIRYDTAELKKALERVDAETAGEYTLSPSSH